MPNTNGAIIWQGASLLTGDPIVAIVTGLTRKSHNAKTGDMRQVFILRSDMAPIDAVRTGADSAICGWCKHRGTPTHHGMGAVTYSGRSCYVTVVQSPQSVYRTFARGGYQELTPSELAPRLAGKSIRLGAYGDPAAVPAIVWQELTEYTSAHTGYTHQWQTPGAEAYRALVMASVDTLAEFTSAQAAGWRTFRVRTSSEVLTSAEITCPASEEAGYRTECASCGLCAGADKKAKSIAIIAHGTGAQSFVSLASLRSPAEYFDPTTGEYGS